MEETAGNGNYVLAYDKSLKQVIKEWNVSGFDIVYKTAVNENQYSLTIILRILL